MARVDPRVSAHLPAQVFHAKENRFQASTIDNLSLGGALLESPFRNFQGITTIKLEIPDFHEVKLFGGVVRSDQKYAAVEFCYSDVNTILTLWNYIQGRIPYEDRCPYCDHAVVQRTDHCDTCGLYLNFTDGRYLDTHIKETFVTRMVNRLKAVSSLKDMQKILHLVDSEYLRMSGQTVDEEFVGTSPAMLELFSMIRKVAGTDMNVLVLGESGTGKELTAKAIYERSQRKNKPFVTVNCAAIPEGLLEAELFGYERGAFTGAYTSKKGKFEVADGGTVFLDEIGDLSLNLQAKLLRFLEDKVVERIGSQEGKKVDVRIIAATNHDLPEAVQNASFRKDLFFRLNAFTIKLPALRERGEDKVILAKYLLRRFTREGNSPVKDFTAEALHAINRYDWPGNIREMINKIRKAVVLASGERITPGDMDLPGGNAEEENLKTMRNITERDAVVNALIENGYVVARAAKSLGVSRPALYALMKKYGITCEGKKKS